MTNPTTTEGVSEERLREILDVFEGRRLLGHSAMRAAERDAADAIIELLTRRSLDTKEAVAQMREVLFFTSYCGDDNPDCSPQRPCAVCLGMSNVFSVNVADASYMRQLAPEWNAGSSPHGGEVEGWNKALDAAAQEIGDTVSLRSGKLAEALADQITGLKRRAAPLPPDSGEPKEAGTQWPPFADPDDYE